MHIPAALILQYALQYGIPAVLEIIQLFKKPNPTLDDWERVFLKAQTAYEKGLRPGAIQPDLAPPAPPAPVVNPFNANPVPQ